MTEQQFCDITKWQGETFPGANPLSKLAHLSEEIVELYADIGSNNPDVRLEFADCFLLLFGCAAVCGMSYDDIVKAIDEKMVINKARKWGEPDEHGVVKHLK